MAFKKTTINELVTKLEKQKFIYTRPISPTNKTKYFKVNVRYIFESLNAIGYSLEGFTFLEEPKSQYLSQTEIRSGENTEEENEKPSKNPKPKYGFIQRIQIQRVLSFLLLLLYRNLFFEKFGIEISFDSAEQVILQHTEHGKDIETAIEEALEWSELTGRKINNPVGSVIYAIQKGWDLVELRTQKKLNEKKIPQKSKSKVKRLPKTISGEINEIQLGEAELAATYEDIEETKALLRSNSNEVLFDSE